MTTPAGWTNDPLRVVADITMGQSPDSKYYSEEDIGLPFLQGCAEFQGRYPKPVLHCSHSKKIALAGSILFSVRAPVGRLNIADRDYIIGRGLAAIRGTRVSQSYLEHVLRSEEPRFRIASQGSTFEAINSTELGYWPISYPTNRHEQAKIAEVLSTVDRAIGQTEALIAKQARIKTGLMQDLMTRGIDRLGTLRSEETHEFKNSPLGQIPHDWTVTTVGEQFSVRAERGRRGLPVMSIMMNDGLVERSSVERRVESELSDEGHALVLAGDITYNMMRMWQGVLGRASFDCLVSPAYVVLRPHATVDSRFAEWLFRDKRMIRAFRKASRGVVDDRLRLYPQDLFPIAFSMPTSLDEQAAIVERLNTVRSIIDSEKATLEKCQRIRAGLMEDLLTGNRRVTALLGQEEAVIA